MIALRSDGLRQAQINDAGLHNRALVGEINFEDAIHPRHFNDDCALALFTANRNRPGTQARTCAARAIRNAVLHQQPHHLRHVFSRLGEQHGQRFRPVGGDRVVFVNQQIRRIGQHRICTANRAQLRNDIGVESHI